ncbi:aminotransferase class III-fold pyridoxal phosphate-dependent enzyme [Myxococcota bacterium]|nr:aminotransferase class III-fold pyridoxal phosphate-dependent enzyme [Myxococcota bacterium]
MPTPAFLHPFARPAAPADAYLDIVRGEGAAVFDAGGRRYVDAIASLWYCAVGYGRRRIADAVAEQICRIPAYCTFDRFTSATTDRLCERLRGLSPFPDARVFLTSGGSESVETAVKLARLAHFVAGRPERTLVVSRAPSYHGVAYAGTTATGLPLNQRGFGPLVPDIVQVPKDDLGALDRVLAEHGHRLAAIIAEPVIGAGGVYPPAPGYLEGLRERCDAHGAYLVLDEVICGFGRLGTWFAAGHYGVRPDLLTFAKAVTSGYQPLGGVLVGPAVHGPLSADPEFVLRHGFTYSGHAAACAAALANLEIMEEEGLVERARHVGARLSQGLRSLVDGERVLELRGEGAVWALGFAPGLDAVAVRERLLERGVIARPLGPSALAFCPPLVIEDADVDLCVEATAAAVGAG